jgi:NTP pyrophosphatase (non-canonical NTP hydrolase)
MAPEMLTLAQYQSLAERTDRAPEQSRRSLDFSLLGLVGEVGSLLSALKKKQRDADSYIGYAPSVVEELGDVLWYASLATRADIALPELARDALRNRSTQDDKPSGVAVTFDALQPNLVNNGPKPPEAFERTLMRLAGEVGLLMADVAAGRVADDRGALFARMSAVFASLVAAANDAGVSLGHAAHRNLCKTFDRWPPERTYPSLFDDAFDRDEQIPRRIEVQILERTVAGATYVFQRCNGINIGDRLTDNKIERDDYRFHDVFHLAYAAVLGWSPVIRGLLKVKRKSKPEVDEAEDGARAALIEEGIATWVFNHAARLNFFENLTSLDYGLLKAVHELVAGYEAERCPLWLWEEAILQGYAAFRELRKYRRGLVVADLLKRTITFQRLPE